MDKTKIEEILVTDFAGHKETEYGIIFESKDGEIRYCLRETYDGDDNKNIELVIFKYVYGEWKGYIYGKKLPYIKKSELFKIHKLMYAVNFSLLS